MSECIEQHGFVKTYSIEEIREQLADYDSNNNDTHSLYEVFLNGCAGWNNIPVEDCISHFIFNILLVPDGETVRFFVTGLTIPYEVITDGLDIDMRFNGL